MPAATAKGLTLIELMVVLAVLTLLALLSVPTFAARAERARLQGTAEMLAADVAQARFEAARRGQPLFMQGSAGERWCWAIATAADCPCGQRQACELSHVAAADHPGVALLDAPDLRFDASGAAAAPARTVRLASTRGERLRVDVSALGRARVCIENGAGVGLPRCASSSS